MMGFAIIGTGAIAQVHVKAIAAIDGAVLAGVYDPSLPRAEAFATSHGCACYAGTEELLRDPAVDIVNICTPSGLHAQYAIMAANAGKHIVIEKPLAVTAGQLDGVIAAVEQNGVKAAVIIQKRFSDAVAKVKAAIDSGLLGNIYSADCIMRYYRTADYYAQNGGWRGTWALDGGGAFMNQGIHGVDLVQYLMGGVRSVFANCRTMARPIEAEDHAYAAVEYQNGAMGMIHSSTVCFPGEPCTITVCGERGTVVLQEDAIVRWDVEGDSWEPPKNTAVLAHRDPLAFPIDNHRFQLQDLICAIEEHRDPVVDVHEGRKAVDIILAAYASSQQGKRIYL